MENASDALKIAFGMLVFVAAISIVIMAFTRVRQTATTILDKSDQTTYYQIYDENGQDKNYSFYRKVGIDTIIANLYSYYNNFYTILFYDGTEIWNDEEEELDFSKGNIKPITLYYTEALDVPSGDANNRQYLTQLGRSTLRVNGNTRQIFGLDINDELTRQEPWSHSERNDKLFIDALVNGKEWIWPNWSRSYAENGENEVKRDSNGIRYLKMRFPYVNAIGGTPFATNTSARFIERIGQYNYEAQYSNNEEDSEGQGVLSGSGQYGKYNMTNQSDSTIQFFDNVTPDDHASGNFVRRNCK